MTDFLIIFGILIILLIIILIISIRFINKPFRDFKRKEKDEFKNNNDY